MSRPALEGGNLLNIDDWTRATEGPRYDWPPAVRNFLEKKGSQRISSLTSYRTPINSVLEKFINVLSLGGLNRAKAEFHQDKLFHLYSVLFLADGSAFRLEKNQVIHIMAFKVMNIDGLKKGEYSIRQVRELLDRQNREELPLGKLQPPQPLTVQQLFENMRGIQGDQLFVYAASNNNCQVFTTTVFKAAGVYSREASTFINQPSEEIVTSLPGYAQRIMDLVTDGAHRFDIALHGAGVKSVKNKVSSVNKMTEYQEYALLLTEKQASRIIEGLPVRLKNEVLHSPSSNTIVCLTKTQLNRIKKALEGGKGLQLTLSQSQIDYCLRHEHARSGGGVLSHAYGRRVPLPANPTVQEIMTSLVPVGVNEAVDYVKAQVEKLPSDVSDFFKHGLDLGAKHSTDQLQKLLGGLAASKNGSRLFLPGEHRR